MLTPYHCKYLAYDLTRKSVDSSDRLSMSLFNASVDLNPHQIEVALFALHSPLSKGVILADEVGLGKTIEAGIILCQLWAERKRRILIICPASIRKQWALELEEKFNLPVFILDAKSYQTSKRSSKNPLLEKSVIIVSYNFANKIRDEIKTILWNMVVIDEAHKLRNAYRASNVIGQNIRWATEDCRKLLLSATPLQNSLLELYGLSTLIDEHIFGDANAFRAQYMNADSNIGDLRNRLQTFCKRTLRNQVMEYIKYTERRAITRPFKPTDDEHKLYEAVSAFLQRDSSYAIPSRQKHLTHIILRKLLASSSLAIAGTLKTMMIRLEKLRDEQINDDPQYTESLFGNEDIEEDLLDEILDDEEDGNVITPSTIDRHKLKEEIAELDRLNKWAKSIGTDTKTSSLVSALEIGFQQMLNIGAEQKALIFTESRRTQDYLKAYLDTHGYAGKTVCYNGSNSGADTTAIYDAWVADNKETGRVSGSRDVDIRTALVEYFRDKAQIMIATEAAAEGVNLQFCSLVINYDLPWNPQRVEQRIGRCHRYGQKHDVVVINFLNERNDADRRVLELLSEKFKLFSGVFGASDEVLGIIESGIDFEKKIFDIYQNCRTPEEIETAFHALQEEMDEKIKARMDDTRRMLFENFDEDVHERLRVQLKNTKMQIDRFSSKFWKLTEEMLNDFAEFYDNELYFHLFKSPKKEIETGRYHLITKEHRSQDVAVDVNDSYLYRLSHPLGEYVIENAKKLDTPTAELVIDISKHATHIHAVEQLKDKSGYLILNKLNIESYDLEEYLLFSGFDDTGQPLDQETCEKIFSCSGRVVRNISLSDDIVDKLKSESQRHSKATVSRSLEQNSKYFNEAREKLEKWADDMVLSAEKALKDTKEQIKILQREARQALNLEEQHEIEQKLQSLGKQQRRQRQEIFKVEDEIIEKRNNLISQLEKRLTGKTDNETLFSVRWTVV
ncbi:MAG: SNF2-related protein [bacterium]